MKKTLIFFMLIISSALIAQNMVSNPSFENWTEGEPDDWTTEDGIVVEPGTEIVHSGDYSLKVTLTTQEQADTDTQNTAFPVTPGVEYTYSAWVYDNDPAGRVGIVLHWEGASSTWPNQYSEDMDEWQQISYSGTVPEGVTALQAGFRFYDVSSNWDGDALLYVDDVSITGFGSEPTISVISPNGGEEWEQDSIHNIVWSSVNFEDNVMIELESVGKNREILVSSTENDGTWEWEIPADQPLGDYKVIVSNANGTDPWDESDSPFTIIEPIPVTPYTIYEIQYTEDPSGDSPHVDERVSTTGVITAMFSNSFFIQDGSGAWNGINVYPEDYDVSMLNIGDEIYLEATVIEYYNKTELTELANLEVLNNGGLPEPVVISTNDLATQEAYESVMVKVENLTVTNPDLGYGEWEIDDGSGACVVGSLGEYTYEPIQDDQIGAITGIVDYSYGAYKLEPRNDDDIDFGSNNSDVTLPKISKVNNYPNPFNPQTTIRFQTNQNTNVKVTIYNLKGEKVTTLQNGYLSAGNHNIVWDGRNRMGKDVTSGIYFYKISTPQYSKTQKMILLK
ncbi:MAG: FlgD immunoglobulin-like domain containing protein [Candidatus Cloacimonadota bacterium]|nr:FlgD immunoglobulin-like domain containing protein [Candidatus Cloacimonadota bacterium]